MKKEKNSYLEVALKKRFCFFHHKVVSNSFLRFNLICKACRKDCCKFLYKVLCLWLFGNVLLLVKDSNLITFLNGFCPNQLTVFLVYRGPCNPVAHHCTENWSFLGRLLMRIWTAVKMSSGWHWCPTLRYNRNRWGRKDVVQLQLDCILQKKHQRKDETALPQSYLSSVHLWNRAGNWTLTFRDLSLWLNYKPVLCHEDLEKSCHWIKERRSTVKHFLLLCGDFCTICSLPHPFTLTTSQIITSILLAPTDLVAEVAWKYLRSDWVV